eukprot:3488_1
MASTKETEEAYSGCKWESVLGKLYDILAETISILDVTTDVIVCIQFYQAGRMVFFGISLTILCLALIAYDVTFILMFANDSAQKKLALFFILLPFTPFLPFIFYYTYQGEDTHLSRFVTWFCCVDISIDNRSGVDENASALRRFFEEKIEKHVGFILESMIEAFPEAILQMTAVVLYHEANLISILSILLSMLSLASKSFVFSIASATNLKQLFFNWLCAVTDVFGIFVVVSWVFYQSNDDLSDAFATIQSVWLYKLYILVFPLVGVASFLFICCLFYEIVEDHCRSLNLSSVCTISFFALLCAFLWCCNVIAAVLSCEILCFTHIAGTFFFLGTKRVPKVKPASECFWTLMNWINSATQHRVGSLYKGCTSYTKKQDKMMRLCAVNYIGYKHYIDDRKCAEYLEKQKADNQYMNVTMRHLRMNNNNVQQSSFTRKFYRWYSSLWREFEEDFGRITRYGFVSIFLAAINFIFGPIYFISRGVTFIFPIWIVLYLYFVHHVNVWNSPSIDLFQVVMITIDLGLYCVLIILFYVNCTEQYLMAHILPSQKRMDLQCFTDDTVKQITNHYYGIVVIPIRKAIVIEQFGPDLGHIILSFLPLDDHYDASDNEVIKVKTVV